MQNAYPTTWTIGHSVVPFATFLSRLKAYRIRTLVDVRTFPRSARAPHFNALPLGSALADENIQYILRGKNLGGRGANINFEGATRELAEMAKQGIRVCILCAEADFRRCHRHKIIEPALLRHGVTVRHISYG